MIKKTIVAIVVIVAAAAVVFAATGNHADSTSNSNQENQQSSVTNSNTSDNTTNETKISPEEAQKIAQKYIDVQGATAGTPKLIKTDGQYYAVPVIVNGTNAGEIDIDAVTGKNMNWIHLSDLQGWKSLAAPLYGVNSIPCTFLIDKDGKIIKRNILGNELEEKLAEILN